MKRHEVREKQRDLEREVEYLRKEQSRISQAESKARAALESLQDSLVVESNQRLVDFILGHPEVIDVLAPEHGSTPCDDSQPNCIDSCPRCASSFDSVQQVRRRIHLGVPDQLFTLNPDPQCNSITIVVGCSSEARHLFHG